jgi:uncharacterized membrane protein
MSVASMQAFFALAIGFAASGLTSSAYQLMTKRQAGFHLVLEGSAWSAAFAVVLLLFATPYMVVRNLVRGGGREARKFEFAMMATILAGMWSLISGTLLVLIYASLASYFAWAGF